MISFSNTQKQQHADVWKTLEKDNFLSREQFHRAVKQAKEQERHVFEILCASHEPQEEKILATFANVLGIPIVRLTERTIPEETLLTIPKQLAEEHSVIVFDITKDAVHVAITNPDHAHVAQVIEKRTNLPAKMYLTTPRDVHIVLKQYPRDLASEFEKIIHDALQQTRTKDASEERMAEFVPIIAMVDRLIETALSDNASDIHLEPEAERVHVRFRIDGMLRKVVDLPRSIVPALTARIKILANMKIDEHRSPQDGRFTIMHDGRDVAVRVSAIPTLHGTKIVLRLLDTKEKDFTLENLGLNTHDHVTLSTEITKPHGMILVTGPTGSGKTTTLYALLRMLNTEEVNIATIEDPIEYGLIGVNQTQVNPNSNLTFVSGLRSLLRQDPNILMVGEIRDPETAKMAVNAAMTGHLVLTTLHTNSAFLALQRLVEMGVEPYLASSIMNVVLGQRLVRKICEGCRTPLPRAKEILQKRWPGVDLARSLAKLVRLDLLPAQTSHTAIQLFYGKGCDACLGTGYRGRIGIYEVFTMNDAMYDTLTSSPQARAIQEEAERQGILTLAEDGLLKILQGQTTLDEVIRVTR